MIRRDRQIFDTAFELVGNGITFYWRPRLDCRGGKRERLGLSDFIICNWCGIKCLLYYRYFDGIEEYCKSWLGILC